MGKICALLSAASGESAARVITGDTGIGKTVVWKHLVKTALPPSFRVLSCRPASSERPLVFSALDDLLGDAAQEFLPRLPEYRRRAVTGALTRGHLWDLPTGKSCLRVLGWAFSVGFW